MDESQNPYAPPKADLAPAPSSVANGGAPMFSPRQASLGTFFGGPLAGTYFLRANFLAKGDTGRAKTTAIVGIAFSLAVVAVLPFLPERMPHAIIPMGYAMVVWSIVEKMQLARADVPTTRVHRAGRVVAVALLGLLLFVSLAMVSTIAVQLGGAGN
jgi:hypothetical protein